MAHLTDMEELLARIQAADMRDYMREAMNCYMAGAYRGSVVLSYIALFDDLLAKLGALSHVNTDAKLIYDSASKKKADQEVYESYLIDQLTSKSIISGLDSSFLGILRTLRNKSAHPSDHRPSPEEARYIFAEVINRFLSQPILSTTQLVDELIGRLKNSNFFPTTNIADIEAIVREEVSKLHEDALPQLVAKLTPCVESADNNTVRNARFFLIGLAKTKKDVVRAAIQSKVIAKSDNPNYADLVIQVFSADGKIFHGLSAPVVVRVRAILEKKIDQITNSLSETNLIHPTYALLSIANAIPEMEFVSTFKEELDKLFNKRAHSEFVVKLVVKHRSLLNTYFPIILTKAGSSTFDIANAFADAVDSLDNHLGSLLDEKQAFQLILAIMKAAHWGAWSSQGVANAKFASVPQLRTKALSYIAGLSAEACDYIKSTLGEVHSIDDFVKSRLTDLASV